MKNIIANFKQNKTDVLLCLAILSFGVILDRVSKYFILFYFVENPISSIEVLPFFNLVLVFNEGVSFGMLSTLPFRRFALSFIVLVIIAVLFFFFLKENRRFPKIAYSLIIAGAIGNTIDRISFGGVIDFLDFHIMSYHWPAFNVADSLICIGVFILILFDFIINKFLKKV